jgi:hypothetical protein
MLKRFVGRELADSRINVLETILETLDVLLCRVEDRNFLLDLDNSRELSGAATDLSVSLCWFSLNRTSWLSLLASVGARMDRVPLGRTKGL